MLIKWDTALNGPKLEPARPSGRHAKIREHDRKRMNPSARTDRMIKVAHSKRKFDKKALLNQRNTVEYARVFVGNIIPGTSPDDIRQFFSCCGEVGQVIIRCSRGNGITTLAPTPDELRDKHNTQYATVEFSRSKGAMLALRLNGRLLNGRPAVVCASPADLPEVRDMIQMRVGKVPNCDLSRDNVPQIQSARTVAREDTQEVIGTSVPANRGRHRLFGYSFAKSVV